MPTEISNLELLLKAQAGKGPAPVERWNPPYCGYIGMSIRSDGTLVAAGANNLGQCQVPTGEFVAAAGGSA